MVFRHTAFEEKCKGERPKQEYVDDLSSFPDRTWMEEKFDSTISNVGMLKIFKSNHFNSVNQMTTKPHSCFCGNIVNLVYDSKTNFSVYVWTGA